jgi:hypothetical protein
VNCKGFARRRFVWYWCVHFFWPRRVAIYVLRSTRLLADYGIVYLHLKKTITTKNRKKDSHRSPNSLKLTLDPLPIIDWPASTVSCLLGASSWFSPSFFPSTGLPVDHRPIGLTHRSINRIGLLWPPTSPVDHPFVRNRMLVNLRGGVN